MESNKNQEMTPSEVGTEDHELQEILDKENLDLEQFLEPKKNKGVDWLPNEEHAWVQQLYLWRTQLKGNSVKRNHDIQEQSGVKMMDNP